MTTGDEHLVLQEHKEVRLVYDECQAVDTALKNQLVVVFTYTYLLPLRKSFTGCVTKITLDIIRHLYANYACISAKGHIGEQQAPLITIK